MKAIRAYLDEVKHMGTPLYRDLLPADQAGPPHTLQKAAELIYLQQALISRASWFILQAPNLVADLVELMWTLEAEELDVHVRFDLAIAECKRRMPQLKLWSHLTPLKQAVFRLLLI